jgi:hypothetical protein
MGGSFGDNDNGAGTGKRPTPTIEGTATEVSVEPDAKEASEQDAPEVEDKPVETGALPPKDDDDTEDTDDDGDTGTDRKPTAAERNTGGPSLASTVLGALTSFITHLAAGLVGGIAVLFAVSWGYLPISGQSEAPDLKPLEDRIGKLEAAPETPDNSAALKTLETRLGALEGKSGEAPPQMAELTDRVTQLENSLKAMAEAAKDGGSVADAAAVSQQINEAEKRLDDKIASALAEAKNTGTADTTAIDTLKREVSDIDAKLKALTEAELGSGDAGQILPELAQLDERLGKIESTLPSLLEAIDEETADTKAATLAIAFANLRSAVDEGRPYAEEIATLAKLSPGATDFGSMPDYEDTGIPTLRDLTASFDEARDAALSAQPPEGDSSIIDRLMANAESLVKVRRVDETAEGNSTGAVLARAGAHLKKGDLEAAVKEVETLKGAPREALAKWLSAAKARLDAQATLQSLQNILLVSLGGSGPSAVENTKEQEQ